MSSEHSQEKWQLHLWLKQNNLTKWGDRVESNETCGISLYDESGQLKDHITYLGERYPDRPWKSITIDDTAPRPRWIRLESNPNVCNRFMRRMGVENIQFVDCLGLDDELLAMLPSRCFAMVLLFPIWKNRDVQYAKYYTESRQNGTWSMGNVYWMKQLVGDACGSIAVTHSVINAHLFNGIELKEGSPMEEFYRNTITMNPRERGEALGSFQSLKKAHEESAKEGQTHHTDMARANFHFISFVPADGCVYELDGGKEGPVNYGTFAGKGFLPTVADIIKKEYFSNVSGSDAMHFSMMALVEGQEIEEDEKPVARHQVKQEDIDYLVSMGFDVQAATTALEACSGNLQRAVELCL